MEFLNFPTVFFYVFSKTHYVFGILLDVTINVATVLSEKLQKNGDPKTFIGEIGVKTKHHTIVLTPDVIIFDKTVSLNLSLI